MATTPPLFIKAANAAGIADMSIRKFRYMVSDGQLPPPVKISGLVRWDREALADAAVEVSWTVVTASGLAAVKRAWARTTTNAAGVYHACGLPLNRLLEVEVTPAEGARARMVTRMPATGFREQHLEVRRD